ncbi:MAG: hypothetical protein MHPDNHAH_01274 [Anaerolineales bacterium]|nr:hypothetical protein [Anaerolineales bacterium]WKZ46659.1 MAG: hypothetical protein QY306_12650 [Anaerolineales bacterium]
MKLFSKQSGYSIAAGVFLVLVVLAINYSLHEEREQKEGAAETSFEQDYNNLLGTFSVEYPGRGVLDYPGNVSADYAKSYAMFLSAELLRAQNEPYFQLSDGAKNAGYWLLDHADVDQDGVIGWGLPVAWDAYGDGTVNPPDTIYTITTAIAINSLLDWLEMDPNAPADWIVSTVDAAFQPFLEPGRITPNGLLVYSLSSYDQQYDTYNPAAYMAGQMQRFSGITSDDVQRRRLRSVADRVMSALLKDKRTDPDGGWYWLYSVNESSPNDAAHALYIVDGIYQYLLHDGTLAKEFVWIDVVRHIDLFYSPKDQTWLRFPQISPASSKEPPRLYEVGMLLHFMGRMGNQAEGLSLFRFALAAYRLPDGTYAKFPVATYGADKPQVINEYMSYLLYGWSSFLFSSPVYASLPARTMDLSQASMFPSMDASQPVLVPFTFFDTADFDIDLEFNVSGLEGNLIVNDRKFHLPARTLPLKIIQWDPTRLIVFTRELWTNQTQVWALDVDSGAFQPIPLPAALNASMFRQAVLYNGHIVFILFDPIEKTNYFYRLLPTDQDEAPVRFDESFKEEFFIDEIYGYRQQPHILVSEFDGQLYFCSDSVLYVYKYAPGAGETSVLNASFLPNHYRALEVASDEDGIYALYKDIDYSANEPDAKEASPFVLHNLADQTIVRDDFADRIPYRLRVMDGTPQVSYVQTQLDMVDLFLWDMRNMPASGMMSAGVNNFEGEVVWTQSYYLNAFIDVLGGTSDYRTASPLSSIKPQIKRRLDFEMALLDKMLMEGPGLLCKTFTVDRSPVLHAVQTGKFLLLMKRYRELPNPIYLKSYLGFRRQVINLNGHIEVLARAEANDRWLNEGRYYLMWPKGSAFWADGVGIPYNHQNMWAAGVLFDEKSENLPENVQQAVMDISTQVLEYEGFLDLIPKNSNWYSNSTGYFEWHYWWGQARAGWSETDHVSQNTPAWSGDGDNIALPVYRTFDAIAILVAGEHGAQILPAGIVEYFRKGVEEDGLELFLSSYLARYGNVPEVSPELAGKYLRFANQPDLRNAIWSYQYLYEHITMPDSSVRSEPLQVIRVGIFALDVLLVFFSALILSALFKIDQPIPWIIGIYLFGYAIIVLTVELGGALSILNSKAFFLVSHSLFLVVLALLWLRGKPRSLWAPLQRLSLDRTSVWRSVRMHWDMWMFAIACGIAFLFLGYSNLVLPQKIDDVVTAHLARVGYWLQHGNLFPWPADTYQLAQLIYPLNAQAQVFWSLLFLRTDQLAGFSQWIVLPIALLNVYGFSRLLRLERRWSVASALLCFSLPNVYLQSLSAMTDLVSAALFLSVVYLLLLGLTLRHTSILILSGLALGLALGTKQTIFFALPGLLCVLLYIWVTRKEVVGHLLSWAGASLGAFLLAGAYVYALNYYWWGSPLGPAATYQGFTQRDSALSLMDLFTRLIETMKSLLSVIFQIDWLSWNFDGNVWPGPALLILIVFALIYIGFLLQDGDKNLTAYSLFGIALIDALILLAVRDFTGSLSRYLIVSIVLTIPLGVAGIVRVVRKLDEGDDARGLRSVSDGQ